MRKAAASAISHDAIAALLATMKFQSDCRRLPFDQPDRDGGHREPADRGGARPRRPPRDEAAQRLVEARPGSRRPRAERRRQGRAERRRHDRPPHADERERPEHDAREEERQRDREDASREPCLDDGARRDQPRDAADDADRGKDAGEHDEVQQQAAQASEPRAPHAEREHERQRRQGVRQRHDERRERAGRKVAGHRVGASAASARRIGRARGRSIKAIHTGGTSDSSASASAVVDGSSCDSGGAKNSATPASAHAAMNARAPR